MKQSVFDKYKRIPRYLVPKVRKRHAAALHQTMNVRWRLFAEGCLRNRYFHERIFKRGPKCLACDKAFNRDDAKVQSKIEKHHADYLHRCTGTILKAEHDDIYRPALPSEFKHVPDCRQCHLDQPEVFEQCLKRIYPVHASCHERIHDKERYFRAKAKKKLMKSFRAAARCE